MKFIGRFFLLIALGFLFLDIQNPIVAPTGAPAATGDGTATDGGSTDSTAADGGAVAATGPGRVMLHSLGERWFSVHPDSYQLISPAISRHVSPWLDDKIVQPLLLQPAFLIFFVLWLVFSLLSWLISRRQDDW